MINPELLVLNPDSRRPAAQQRRLWGFFPPQVAWCLYLSILLMAGSLVSANAQTPPPVLVSEPTSTRAIALESVSFVPEPFKLISPYFPGADRRTRIMLFAVNLSLQPGETLSSVTADAEDASHRHYNLLVEYVGPVPEQQWLTAVVLRLSDDLGDVGDVLVRVSHQGIGSNRVRIAIGHKGGGPPDDPGAAPTPAPPYLIIGQVTADGPGLSGVTVTLNGPQTETLVTDSSGAYQFTVLAAGGTYSITPAKPYYDFSAGPTFNNLSNNQTNVNFIARRQAYTINGKVLDDTGQGLDGVQMTVRNVAETTMGTALTAGGGSYSFANLPAGFGYTVTPGSNSFFTFTPRSTTLLTGNLIFDFNGTRHSYTIGGRTMDATGGAIGGVTISLSGSRSATVTSDNSGVFSFSGLPAGGNYTLTPSTTPFYTFTAQSINNLSSNQTANFTGTLRQYSISGHVMDGTNGIGGVTVNLSGSRSASTTTDSSGAFSFSGLPAGGNYSVTPPTTSFYTFTTQSFTNLSNNQSANLTGTLRQYSISGRIKDGANGLGGVNVGLSGSSQATASTDSMGNYTFANLDAGRNYTVVPSKTHYVFTPTSQAFNNLSGNQTADFQGALRSYAVTGRVTDSAGQGVVGVTVTMNGSQTNTVLTGSDGSYSFSATALGNYEFTPSIEQDWYTFSPLNQALNNLSSDQAVNFTATLAPIPNPAYVLEFDGSPRTVDYGYFWDPGVDLGHFFWEFWAMPGNNAGARYMISDGYGGAHAILYGFAAYGSAETGRYRLFGNIFDGVNVVSFISDQGPAAGEWGHFAVGWDGQNIIIYFNGVPVGRQAFVGPRRTPGPGGGGSWLLIGGSDHSNLDGRIAQVRGYEGNNPREDPAGVDQTLVQSSFAPQTVFSPDGNLLSYYFRSAQRVADLSKGYGGKTHTGLTRGTLNGYFDPCTGCPAPQYTVDATAPNFATGTAPAPVLVDSAPAPPSGARIFDSFSRANSTYVFNGQGGLGATEGGAAGSRVWQTNQNSSQPQPFGILNGRAVMLANATYLTWIPTASSSANLDIRVERRAGSAGSGLDTGLSFRVLDDRNFFFAYTSVGDNDSSPRKLTVGYYLEGQRVNLMSGISMPASWTTLRVVTKISGEVTVYADATQVHSTTNTILVNATGCGLYNNSAGLGLVNRWDNFTVFDAP